MAMAADARPIVQAHPLRLQVTRILLVMLSAAAWIISIDLLKVTGGATASLPILSQFCGEGAGERNDCRSVLTSRYGGVGTGSARVPWAALGAGYFAVLLLWFLLVGVPTRRQMYWHWIMIGLCLVGAAISIHLITTLMDLNRYCAGCIAIHAINGLILLLMVAALFMHPSEVRANGYPAPAHAIAALLAGLLALLLHIQVVGRLAASVQLASLNGRLESLIKDPEFVAWDYGRQPLAALAVNENELMSGAADAPNTVIVYADLQCERCKDAHQLLERLVQQYPGLLRVVYRHYPLDWSCNDSKFVGNLHPDACQAARAVASVHQAQGPAEALKLMHVLYEDQDNLSRAEYAKWARAAGVDPADVDHMRSEAVAQRIRADILSGQELRIGSAPAVFLNGRRLTYWHIQPTWERLLGIPQSQPASSQPGR